MMNVGGRVGALWIGALEAYMDEDFLQKAMQIMGATGVLSIKVMLPKANYGFINFDSDKTAIIAMHRLRGKIIPNSVPPIRFNVNHDITRQQQPGEGVFVGDLTSEVDDFALYSCFSHCYGSIQYASVAMNDSGISKGYGFVKLNNKKDQQHALNRKTFDTGFGPIRVREKLYQLFEKAPLLWTASGFRTCDQGSLFVQKT